MTTYKPTETTTDRNDSGSSVQRELSYLSRHVVFSVTQAVQLYIRQEFAKVGQEFAKVGVYFELFSPYIYCTGQTKLGIKLLTRNF